MVEQKAERVVLSPNLKKEYEDYFNGKIDLIGLIGFETQHFGFFLTPYNPSDIIKLKIKEIKIGDVTINDLDLITGQISAIGKFLKTLFKNVNGFEVIFFSNEKMIEISVLGYEEVQLILLSKKPLISINDFVSKVYDKINLSAFKDVLRDSRGNVYNKSLANWSDSINKIEGRSFFSDGYINNGFMIRNVKNDYMKKSPNLLMHIPSNDEDKLLLNLVIKSLNDWGG